MLRFCYYAEENLPNCARPAVGFCGTKMITFKVEVFGGAKTHVAPTLFDGGATCPRCPPPPPLPSPLVDMLNAEHREGSSKGISFSYLGS